jgi:hypothetical protein
MTDPDAGSIWLFFGPVNALIYGAVGYTLWLFLVGNDDSSPASKQGTLRSTARSVIGWVITAYSWRKIPITLICLP